VGLKKGRNRRLADEIGKDCPFKTEEEVGRNMRLVDEIGKD
jgi:hypothetical protein